MSGWPKKIGRIARMDWDEARTRLGQEFHKRGDLMRHQLGLAPPKIVLREITGAPGTFLFREDEPLQRASLLRDLMPEQSAEIIRSADKICAHQFDLLGYEGLELGPEIDWHLDPVHGKRAPLVPWSKIPFLDFEVVGDHKITWELNRHQHLVTLAKTRLLTGDDRFVAELIKQWRAWVWANPYPLGINWGSTLEIAFRSLSWIWIDHLLGQDEMYLQVRVDVLSQLAFHGRYIERYLSTYFSPNTHLLGEAVALFYLGVLYPQIPGSEKWKAEGWRIVVQEAQRQVRPDGVYFEQSLHYHVYALDFFLYARILAAKNGIPIPATFDETLLRMLDVIEALAQAGPAEGFGDDDGGRVFDPRRNRTEHMTDPLAIGSLAYHREYTSAPMTEESIWLFGEEAIRLRQPVTREQSSMAFPDGGLYILAGAGPRPHAIVIDAGPQGVGRCGHGHADALSVRLTMGGSRWLVDSGSGVYISKDRQDRNEPRGTGAHNTLRVDGLDQAVADEPFSWTDIPATSVERWLTGKTFSYFVGSHNGFERLADPVRHQRMVFHSRGALDGGLSFVRDVAVGRSEHELEIFWHFASPLKVRGVHPNQFSIDGQGAGTLSMVFAENDPWKVEAGQHRISPAYGMYEHGPSIRNSTRLRLPAETATVLMAGANASLTPAHLTLQTGSGVVAYELRQGEKTFRFFVSRADEIWTFAPLKSDAQFVYCAFAKEQLIHLVAIGGTFIQWEGSDPIETGASSQFVEWDSHDGPFDTEDHLRNLKSIERTAGSMESHGITNANPSYVEKR